MIFESSGTTGVTPGRHYVTDLKLYEESFLKLSGFFTVIPAEYLIIALLPSYTEREGSSLVYMADKLIKESRHPLSGFYKGKTDDILNVIKKGKEEGIRDFITGSQFRTS